VSGEFSNLTWIAHPSVTQLYCTVYTVHIPIDVHMHIAGIHFTGTEKGEANMHVLVQVDVPQS
jgi:hypothetical protein